MNPQETEQNNRQNVAVARYLGSKGFDPFISVSGERYRCADLDDEQIIHLSEQQGPRMLLSVGGDANSYIAIYAKTAEARSLVEQHLRLSPCQIVSSDESKAFYLFSRGADVTKRVPTEELVSQCRTVQLQCLYHAAIPAPDFNFYAEEGSDWRFRFPTADNSGWRTLPEIKASDLENLAVKVQFFFGEIKPPPLLKLHAKPLPPELYPEALREFFLDGGLRLKCHPEHIMGTAYALLNLLCSKKVMIQDSGDNQDLRQYTGGYFVLVGDSGSNKDGAMAYVRGVLEIIKEGRRKRMAPQIDEYEAAKKNAAIQIAAIDRAITKSILEECGYSDGPPRKDGARKLSKEELEAKKSKVETDLQAKRVINVDYTFDDPNREKLEEDHVDNPRGLLGWYNEISKLYEELFGPHWPKWRELLQKGWSGKEPQSTRRMSRVVEISEFAIHLVGATQGDTHDQFMRDLIREHRDTDGVESRLIKIYPDYRPTTVQDARKRDRNAAAWNRALKVFHALDDEFQFKLQAKEHTKTGAALIRLSDEAQKVFDQWFSENDRSSEWWSNRNKWMELFLNKMPPCAARLALLFHCIEWADKWSDKPMECPNPTEVSEDNLRRALATCDAFVEYAKMFYLKAGSPEIAVAHSIYDRILRGHIRHNANIREELIRGDFPELKVEKLVYAGIEILERCNCVRLNKLDSQSGKGRKAKHLYINPKLLERASSVASVAEQLDDECFASTRRQRPTEVFQSKWFDVQKASVEASAELETESRDLTDDGEIAI